MQFVFPFTHFAAMMILAVSTAEKDRGDREGKRGGGAPEEKAICLRGRETERYVFLLIN